uniref:NADH dehydrogenase subunit 6 n=1 Tax=Aponsila sp. FS-2019 TaxID=2575685 RepID=A0A4D6X398_9HEMI|nr:NADH dehydrogenase subunit 6 [Aponsila sp. FS-2019]
MMYVLYSLMTSIALMMMFLKHPMSMGFMLIMQTMVIAMITGMFMKSFLMSYIIVIIMLSGALVLFIYMASVASNEKFKMSIKMFIMVPLITLMSSGYLYLFGGMNMQEESEMIIKSVMKLFNNLSMYMTMMMMVYLLFTMIVASNIANTNEGPLRMKMYE